MTDHSHAREVQQGLKELGKELPETVMAFSRLHGQAMSDGALPASTKELIAVAISICDRCEPCIGYHLESALAAGASPEEARDAIGVAIMMGGGPAAVYAAKAGRILEQRLAPTAG